MKVLSRRKFIQLSSATGAFLAIGYVPDAAGDDKLIAQTTFDPSRLDLNQFISIGTDNSIVLYNHRPEMGQGTYQAIPMILAEELEVDIDKIEIRPAAANSKLYGSQMVVGSRSIQSEFDKLRKMGAAAREMLRQAAANKWKVSIEQCKAQNGTVVGSSAGAKLTYGDLVREAATLSAPENPPLKNHSDYSIIGKPVKRKDIPLKTNGQAMFGIDISVPGMLYASIARSPVFLGRVRGFNKEEVLKIPGVRHVIQTSREVYGSKREGVAVLAESYWSAQQGRKALNVEWDTQGLEKISGEHILSDSYEASKMEGDELFNTGDVVVAFGKGTIIEAAYETPYQAHVPMEPMNAIVHVTDTDASFWGSTQNPNGIRSFLSKTYHLPEEKININYTFMGGGFGRRSMTDVAEEAADLSKKSGVPVKVVWTREDDLTQGPFRACSLNVCRAVMDAQGKVIALEHKVVAQEIQNQTGPNMKAGRQIMGGITTAYLIPNLAVRGVLRKRHVPISYWRSVYHSTNVFAHECFLDELACQAKKDPIQFRLDMLDDPRFRKVLQLVAEKTNWNVPKSKGTGRGVAIAERSGAHFAQVIEVELRGKQIVPVKITTALDVGTCINPDTVKAQTEGSVVMGLTAAYNGLTIRNGAVLEQNFDTYPLLAINDCPEIETFIVDSDAPPDGAGESGLPTVAPALANAIFDLTGKRFRKLPMDLRGKA